MNPKCWLLEGHVARLNLPGVSLAFDADRPADGLTQIPFPLGLCPGRLLGVAVRSNRPPRRSRIGMSAATT